MSNSDAKYAPVSKEDMELNDVSVVDGSGPSLPRQSSTNRCTVREKTHAERRSERLNTELLTAVEAGDRDKVQRLLQSGVSPNATCRGALMTTVGHIAALNGQKEIFQDLLKAGADVRARDTKGRQPIHMASWGGHIDILKLILERFKDVNSQIQVQSQVEMDCLDSWNHDHENLSNTMILDDLFPGSTPLHLACMKALANVVNYLLESGADVNLEDERGLTPLDVTGINQTVEGYSSILATDSNKTVKHTRKMFSPAIDPVHGIVNELIRNDAKVPECKKTGKRSSVKNFTTLHTAVEKEDVRLIECLLQNGASLETWNSEGDTPLHLAVKTRSLEVLQKIVDIAGHNVDIRDMQRRTPLQVAVKLGWSFGVEVLLEAGAKVTTSNNSGETVFHLAAELGNRAMLEEFLSIDHSQAVLEKRDQKHRTPLFVAVDNNHLPCVIALTENGADLTAKLPGNISVLHLAACKNSPNAIQYFLNDEAANSLKDSRSQEDKRGLTPLHVAAENGYTECVENLLNGGCDPCIRSTQEPEKGVTPLHQAAKNGHLPVIKTIIKRESKSLTISTSDGWLPLHYAAGFGHSHCVRYMIRNGADISEEITNKTGEYSRMNGLEIILYCMPQPVDFLEEIFDSYLEVNNYPLSDPKCEVAVKYDVLVPSTKKSRRQLKILNAVLNSENDNLVDRILIHPLVEIFLYLKWRKLRFFFIMMTTLYLILTMSLTILAQLTFVLKTTDTIFMICAEVARYIMFASLIPIVLIEIVNAAQRQRYYVYNYESWVKWAMICSTISIGLPVVEATEAWARYVTSIAVLLSWIELLFLLAHFPIWGYYVLMFSTVAKNLLKVMFTFGFLFVGFTFAFLILFEGSAPFINFFHSALKVIIMMSEMDYENTFENQKEVTAFSMIGRFMFVTFLILVSVVMMNLMVGLAVSDINKLMEQGRAQKMAKQTAFLSLIESLVYSSKLEAILPSRVLKCLDSRRSVPEMTIIKPAKSIHLDKNPVPKSLRDAVLAKVRDVQNKREENKDNVNLLNLENKIDVLIDNVNPRKLSSASTIV